MPIPAPVANATMRKRGRRFEKPPSDHCVIPRRAFKLLSKLCIKVCAELWERGVVFCCVGKTEALFLLVSVLPKILDLCTDSSCSKALYSEEVMLPAFLAHCASFNTDVSFLLIELTEARFASIARMYSCSFAVVKRFAIFMLFKISRRSLD